ncbi:MAG TPA: class I SAM-dependent methyltransferase [Aeromonadales bacterium]|nr:class I SAM-dependent methyltransferase [Aeromonadales bacterium]
MPCPSCESKLEKPFGEKNSYHLTCCQNCGLIYVENMPSNEVLHDFYQNYHKTSQYTAKLDSKLRRAKKRIKCIKKYTQGKRFIDVGCNAGFAVEAARICGFDAQGVDVDGKTIALAKKFFPEACYQSKSIQKIAAEGQQFDLIYCSEVLEHLPSLHDFVKALYDGLDKNGVLYLTTPDIGHYSLPGNTEKLLKWDAVRPPEHLYYFSRKSLQYLFLQAGFSKLKFQFNFKPTLKLLAWK